MKNEIDKKITILLVVAGVIGGCIGGFIPILSAFFEDSTINAIVIYPPDYYSIIRGGYHHPSDILVIPLHIVNEYNSPAYISNLTITLNKVNSNSTIEKGATTFILKGEFSSISKDEFENKFRYRESFIVDKKSSLTTFGAFRINQYWDINNKQAREFKFKTPDRYDYKMKIDMDILNKKLSSNVFDFSIYSSVNDLQPWIDDNKTIGQFGEWSNDFY